MALLGNVQGKSILDIGCGPGLLAKQLLYASCKFTGIDTAYAMIDECRKDKELQNFYFQVIDPLKYFEENKAVKYHTIVCMGLFEYLNLDYTNSLMKFISEHLYLGGNLIATYPNAYSPYRLSDRIYRKLFGKDTMVPPYTPGVSHKEFIEGTLIKEWSNYSLKVNKAVYYNYRLIPKPLDAYLKMVDLFISKKLQVLSESALRYLGTAMVLRGEKC